MLSGREQAATIVEAVRLGAADYVVKPDDPEGLGEIALDAAIKSAIEKTRLVSEITELRRQLSDDQDRAFLFWGDSPEMQTIAQVIEQVSDSDVTVLIRGESGVGKELVARAIHQRSPRKDRPFVKVNCAALPAELLESELFGHEKGAFTGAATTRIGKFEQADTGTIFLDEIGEMKAALQAKLLHVLQDAQFTKLGSNKTINVDVRVVAATNRDLEADDAARRVPRGPLLPAQGDRGHRAAAARAAGRDPAPHRLLHRPLLAPLQPAGAAAVGRAAQLFQTYEWPGNIRELENMIKRIVILQDEQLVVRELTSRAGRIRTPTYRRRASASAAAVTPPRRRSAGDDRAERTTSDDAGRAPPTSRRPAAGRCRAKRPLDSRADSHRRHAAPGPLEPPQGRGTARRQLQDPAQQDQGDAASSGPDRVDSWWVRVGSSSTPA